MLVLLIPDLKELLVQGNYWNAFQNEVKTMYFLSEMEIQNTQAHWLEE